MAHRTVASESDKRVFREYVKFLHSRKDRVPCPLCQDLVLPKAFENHCTQHHHLNSKLCCVWCQGAVSWPSLAKSQNAEHLFHCSRRFFVIHLVPNPESPPIDSFIATPFCQENDLFGRARDSQPRAYEDVWLLPLPPARITYDIESLNLAASCVRAYLDREKTQYWCHAIVRGVAFQSFLEAMDADESCTRTLPFFCWCDGGQLQEVRHRRHRHMIVVSPSRDHFDQNVWKKIRVAPADKPNRRFRALHTEPIRSALHLVNTLGYVSQRKSICLFSGDTPDSAETLNHYCIRRSVPQDYRLPLVLEWPNGLYDLLDQEFKNLAYDKLVRADMRFVDAKWRIPIRSIPGISWGKQLPLNRQWHPCERPTVHCLHLLNGKNQYFKFKNSPTSFTLSLYDAVQGDVWPPRPFHQNLIRKFRPLVDRNTELEAENAELRDDNTQLLRNAQLLQNENTQLLRNEIAQLRAEVTQLRAQLRSEDRSGSP